MFAKFRIKVMKNFSLSIMSTVLQVIDGGFVIGAKS